MNTRQVCCGLSLLFCSERSFSVSLNPWDVGLSLCFKDSKDLQLAYVLISLSLIFHPLCFQNIYKLLVRLKYRTTWMKQLHDFKSKILLCVNKNRLSTSQLCNLLKGTRQHKFVSISNIHVPHPELNVMLSWWVTQSKKITCVLIRYLLP